MGDRFLTAKKEYNDEVEYWKEFNKKKYEGTNYYMCPRCHKTRHSKYDHKICPSCQKEVKKVPKPEVYLFQCFKCRQMKKDRVKGIMVCRDCSHSQGLPRYDISASVSLADQISRSIDGLPGAFIYFITSVSFILWMSF